MRCKRIPKKPVGPSQMSFTPCSPKLIAIASTSNWKRNGGRLTWREIFVLTRLANQKASLRPVNTQETENAGSTLHRHINYGLRVTGELMLNGQERMERGTR